MEFYSSFQIHIEIKSNLPLLHNHCTTIIAHKLVIGVNTITIINMGEMLGVGLN